MERGYKSYNIEELNHGDHLCVLYQTDEEHKDLITPYLRSGLENNEKVFYIVDARTSEMVLNYLLDDGMEVDPYLESGQLSMLTVSESYMNGGVFDPEGMIKMLTEETEKALKEGYAALRVTGEMSWALRGLPGSERLIEYETKLNEFFPTNKALAICQYDCRVFEPEILLDILTTHPIAVIGTEIYENFYYVPTEDFLAGKGPKRTLEHWIENLKLRKKAELDLKASEKKYRQLVENAQEGIWSIDTESKTTFVNPRMAEILGYDVDEMMGHSLFSFMDERGVELANYNLERGKQGLKKQYDFEFIRKDGNRIYTSLETSPIFDGDEKYVGAIAMVSDITNRRKMENTLRESEERYSLTLDAVNDGLWEWNVTSGDAFFSPNYYKVLGYHPGEFPANYKTWRLLVHPDDRDTVEKELQESIKSGSGFEINLRMKTKSWKWLWVLIRGKAIEKDSTGNATRMVGTLSDITERISAEKKINDSLKEKEMLLKEIHHRVKNNLMIISSLLNLQSRQIKDKASKDIFKESQNRARSMALIHERLYQSTDLKRIDFGDYIGSLSKELFHTYAGDLGHIELKVNVDDIFLDINTAIPLGLIVNELITNSLKHAFPEGKMGEINIDFHPQDDHFEFSVKDNGIGFPKDLDFHNTNSLGMQMVTSLTDQIDGEIELNRSQGTEFKITFKDLDIK
ncbi:MAG: hypothetical protein CVV28_09295 [Methanobacteriales archaeon HGW-Methanobacteriales-1]|jgi:PAS domain S-box-containing protein|nr:MAG: hypothetical protein CVV28_09295 [Methanobacteriales archaeon HGW-Methanobacteriales-1]